MSNRIVHQLRARSDHHRQRHRAHRIAIADWHRCRQDLLPAQASSRQRHRARSPPSRRRILRSLPPGHHAAARHSVQRIERADSPAGAFRRRPHRAATRRHRLELHPHSASSRSGRRHSLSLRRQAAPGAGRPRTPRRSSRRASRRSTSSTRSAAQNLILPAGTAKIGQFEYQVDINGPPPNRRRAQRRSHQDRQRLNRLHSRYRPRPRRLSAADQHRPRRTASAPR